MSQTADHTAANGSGGGRGFLAQAWLVLVLAAGFGAALAFVQLRLGDVIAANKRRETLARIPELVQNPPQSGGPAAVDIAAGWVRSPADGDRKTYRVFKVSRNGLPAGWVLKAAGQGYADRIEILVGLDPGARTLTGVYVLEQKETPGLGNKITAPEWRGQFAGKPADRPLTVQKTNGGGPAAVDAVTGATISSAAVTAIVNRAVGDVRQQLTAGSVRFETGAPNE